MADVDFSEVNQLAADLGQVADTAGNFVNSAVQVSSGKVKSKAARSVGRRRHFKQAAQAIDYEITTLHAFGVSVIKSEVGYDKEKPAGPLGNLIEFGAPDAPGGPLPPTSDLVIALAATQDDFTKGLDKALEDAERKAGLR